MKNITGTADTFIWNDCEGFTHLADAIILKHLVNELDTSFHPRFLELGVFHGRLFLSMLDNCQHLTAFGIDPFIDMDEDRNIFQDNIQDYKVRGKAKHFESWEHFFESSTSTTPYTTIVHIDGDHSYHLVCTDGRNGARILLDEQHGSKESRAGGIIVFDDVWSSTFPGVTAASFKVIYEYHLAPFLATKAKLYCCLPQHHPFWLGTLSRILNKFGINYELGFPDESGEEKYLQSNAINGFDVMNAIDEKGLENLFSVSIKHYQNPESQKFQLRKFLRPFLAPIKQGLIDKIQKL